MNITTVSIDLAKQVFQVHGVDERGKAVLKKQLKRDQVLPFFANFQSCLTVWRPMVVRISGRGNWRYWGIP